MNSHYTVRIFIVQEKQPNQTLNQGENHENFYDLLFTTSKNQGKYLEALALITKASQLQMDTVASDLAWQSWDAQSADTVNA